MKRLERAIYEAKAHADYILVSIQAHELSGNTKEAPADFLAEFAHRAIYFNAHAVLGHVAPLLRPLEIYKRCPMLSRNKIFRIKKDV